MEKLIKIKQSKASKQHVCDATFMIQEEINNSDEPVYSLLADLPEQLHSILHEVLSGEHDKIKKGEVYQRVTILSDEAGAYILIHQKMKVRKLLNYLVRSGWIDIW